MLPQIPTTFRAALTPLLLLIVAAATGCSGCEPASCPEQPCGPGAYCSDGVCFAESEGCSGCADGEHCFRGGCVPDGMQCGAGEDFCDPTLEIASGFHCVDWDGSSGDPPRCSSYCEDNGTCADNAVCFGLQAGSGTQCSSPTACPDGELCVQQQCRTTACRPSECEGVLAGDATCADKYGQSSRFPNGAKCQTLESGASYCLPAGPGQLGDSCVDVDTASRNNDFSRSCDIGFACVDGRCEVPCSAEGDCEGDQGCIGLDEGRVAEGVGYCAEACEPFTSGACDGGTCLPINSIEGTCTPAGQAGIGDACTPGAGECASGTICVEYAGANSEQGIEQQARCQPLCNTTVSSANADGSIDPEAQDARDDTCPQPEAAPASLRIVHVSETLGAVDIYRRGEDAPLAEDVDFESRVPEDGAGDWLELDPGQYRFDVLEAGAPSSDLPLITVSASLGEGQGRTVAIGPPTPSSSEDATATTFVHEAPEVDVPEVRVVHLVSDAGDFDAVAVSQGDDVTDPSARVILGQELSLGDVGDFTAVPDTTLDLYLFPAGSDYSDEANAVLTLTGVQLDGDSTVYLRGTLDETDFFDAGLPTVVATPPAPQSRGAGPSYTCVALEDRAYGFCQQLCVDGPADFGTGVCQGESMGCAPREFADRGEWETVCRPVGEAGREQPCDPTVSAGQCQEGLYCLEYGNTAPHVASSDLRGLCTSLCSTDPDIDTSLSCENGQSCADLSFTDRFEVGQCGFECTPDAQYTDTSCPSGLQSCLPVSSLSAAPSGQGQETPEVTREQSYCSQSGDIPPGTQCFGFDCAPGSECMYERSEQGDLVSTLVSQYFAAGSTPTCHRQCDPFDGDSSDFECESGETCLFNFPWSAEVGHCAAIVEDLNPGDPCERPGLSCGPDSICVRDGEVPTCFRFCDYLGPDAQGALSGSTCPSGYACTPFVRDIGICARQE
jgi:hypothetical protein